jgi:eukaryotic-like serine/threonine-protein kinase
MGVVFAARQISLNRMVAIKLLARHLATDAKFAERFAREARSAARLQHPHIVAVFSNGSEQGFSYYSMQLVEGKNLAEVLTGVKRLLEDDAHSASDHDDYPRRLLSTDASRFSSSPVTRGTPTKIPSSIGETAEPSSGKTLIAHKGNKTDVVRDSSKQSSSRISMSENRSKREAYYKNIATLARDVAWALEYAHQQGTVHRDIKPSNLILDKSGQIWITDFGLAKLDSEQRMTQVGDILGTLRYVAPEQLDGVTAPSCDIYGVGVTLYELVTLQPAWSGNNHAQIMQRVRSDSVVRPRFVEPAIPRDLETIILTAMARNPADRYRSARELGDDLERFCNDQPIRARKPSSVESLLRWSRRNRLAAASIVSVLFLAAVVVPAITISYSMMWRNEATRAQNAEKNTKIANENSQQQLAESLIQQARAVRETGTISAREDSIKALQTANQVLNELSPELGRSLSHDAQLREEAVAALALPAFREAFPFSLKETKKDLSSFIYADDSLLVFRENLGERVVTAIYDTQDLTKPIRQFDVNADLAELNRQKTHLLTHANFHDKLMDLAIWEIKSGKKLWGVRAPPYQGQFSPNHDHLIAIDQTGRPVIVELETGKARRGPIVCDPSRIPLVYCNPSTEILALLYQDHVEIRNFSDARILRKIRVPKREVVFENACWSPRDNWFAVKSTDGNIQVFDPKSWEISRNLKAHVVGGSKFSTTADGRYLETKTWNKRIQIFDLNSGECVANIAPEFDGQFLNFSNYLIGPLYDGIHSKMLELVPSNVYIQHAVSPDVMFEPRELSVSPDGRLVIVNISSGELVAIELESGRQLMIPGRVSSLSFDGKGDLWGLTSGQLIRWPLISSADVIQFGEPIPVSQIVGHAFAVDPTGKYFVWNQNGGVASGTIDQIAGAQRKHGNDVRKVAVSSDLKWIVGSGHWYNGCWVYETNSDRSWDLAPKSKGTVPSFSADGKFLALTLPGEALHLYRCGEWEKPLMTWGPAIGQPPFSPDGRLLAISFDVESISLIRLEDLQIVQRLTHPEEQTVISLAFTPDGTRLLFTSEESNCVHEWNLGVLKKEMDAIGISAEGLPDSKTMVTSRPVAEENNENWIEFASEYQLLLKLDKAVERRDKEQIRECFEKLCRAVPNNPQYSNGLAWKIIQDPGSTMDDKADALGWVRKALKMDEDNADYLNTYGVCLLRLNQLDEAIAALEDARNQRKENQDPCVDDYFMAIAHAKKERYREALNHWSRGFRSHYQFRSKDVDSMSAFYESTGFLLRCLIIPPNKK